MTIDEAIKILKNSFPEPDYKKIHDAVDTVVKMMHQPCESDLIRRSDAEKVIDRFIGYLDEDMITRIKIKLRQDAPSVQPETAKRITGMSRDGMTMWYQCDMCNEPVDEKDMFCRGCGRRLVDG